MKKYLFLFLLLLTIKITAQEPVSNNEQIIKYSHFTLSYNDEFKQPEWVYYMLTKTDLSTKVKRSNNFRSDSKVDKSSTPEEYINTGFDRGHMSPAADNTNQQSNSESFYMTNMSPQLPTFNRGIWVTLEEWVRKQAQSFDTIYVATGPVFVNCLGYAGTVTIPGYYYKCLLRYDNKKPYTIAFLLPHIGAVGEISDYMVPINTVETLTGINFFPQLKEPDENQLGLKQWKQ